MKSLKYEKKNKNSTHISLYFLSFYSPSFISKELSVTQVVLEPSPC